MTIAKIVANVLSNALIDKYVNQRLSRQERTQIIDSIRCSLPESIKRSERDALRAILDLNNREIIDLRDGFAYVNTDSIIAAVKSGLSAEQILKSIADESPDSAKQGGKPYLRIISNMGDYSVDHPIMQLATNPIILASIASYMGEAPLVADCQVLYSPPSNQVPGLTKKEKVYTFVKNNLGYSSKYRGSQLSHIDEDYPHTVKLWVYLTDVDKNTGPFTLLPGPVSDEVALYLGKNSSKKVSDRKLKGFMHHKLSIEGKSNTVFIADTGRCYHYGSRDVNSLTGRVAVVIHYTSIFSIYTFEQGYASQRALKIKKLLAGGSTQALDILTRDSKKLHSY